VRQFTLTAKEFAVSETTVRWHWRLLDVSNYRTVDFAASMNLTSPQYMALSGLYDWLEPQAGGDGDPLARQQAALAALGTWVTENLLGPIAKEIAKARPCTVRLWQAPGAPLDVISLPLELAMVDGKPLARHVDVSFVIDLDAPEHCALPASPPLSRPLRVLGLFSLPYGAASMNLRKERYELERLVDLLKGSGREVTLQTLQYGTTRERLTEALDDGDGWDVVHLSGHGRTGLFVMERPDGSRDLVPGQELCDLLEPLRNRVRLVTISACESAQRVVRHDLPADGAAQGGAAEGGADPASDAPPGDGARALAPAIAGNLNCAVLGMRYPVTEPFAAAFTQKLYTLMFDKGMPLARARARAAAEASSPPAIGKRPPLSLVSCALYGTTALTLTLRARDEGKPAAFTPAMVRLAGVPDRPRHFVGRSSPMTEVAKALAPYSGTSVVVIEGAAGIGKTTVALETAYAYSQRVNFPVVAWATTPDDIPRALTGKIPFLDMSALRDAESGAQDLADSVTAYFKDHRVLLVIDNADAGLTEAGNWRDERLDLLIKAMTEHTGLARVIITTGRPIASLNPAATAAMRLGPLTITEAFLLASELPALGSLLTGPARRLALDVLAAADGRPGWLMTAEGLAADEDGLATWVLNSRAADPR
jgi:CHAT domain/NB-ARC domain